MASLVFLNVTFFVIFKHRASSSNFTFEKLKLIFPFRHCVSRLRSEWITEKRLHEKSWQKKKLLNVSQDMKLLYVKHARGQAFSKEQKQTFCNVFYHCLIDGYNQFEAFTKSAEMTGIARRSMERIVKEKLACETLIDNNCKFPNTQTIFEKLSEEQIKR